MNTPNFIGLMKIIGILLIVQGIVRLGFVTNTILQAPADLLENSPVFLIVSVVMPALLASAGAGAGVLIVQLVPAARAFGLAVCGVCLLYQVYAFGTGLYFLATRPDVILAWPFWILGPSYIALYIAALIFLAQWRPDPRLS